MSNREVLKMFKIEFKTGGAAFDEPYKASEIKRILKEITEKVECGYTSGKVIDINGNCVGEWELI